MTFFLSMTCFKRHASILAITGAMLVALPTSHAIAQSAPQASVALSPTCEITYVGTFGSTAIDAKMGRVAQVPSERMLDKNLYIGQPGNQIQMEIGTSFGVLRKITNIQDGQKLSLVITHPEMINPNGQVSTRTVMSSAVSGIGDLYRFDFPYAMVPGKWNFDYQLRGKSLCQQSFDLR